MKRRLLAVLLAAMLCVGLIPVGALAAEPIQISDAAGLAAISGDTSGSYVLTGDIALTEDWTPISGFSGTLDGDGYTISGLTVTGSASEAGLFASLGTGATVTDLVLANCNVSSSAYSGSVGALAGKISGSNVTIENVGVSGTVSATGSSSYVGGLVGTMTYGTTFRNCYSMATVKGANRTGGLIGGLAAGTGITNCYATGSVTASGGYVGGLFGYGYLYGNVTMTNCYSAATVDGSNKYGFGYTGGTKSYWKLTNCCWDSDLCTTGVYGSVSNITGKTTDEMKALAGTLGDAFQDDSGLNGGYPILSWQFVPDPDSTWTVTFHVVPKEATLTWDGTAQAVTEDGVYTIENVPYNTDHAWSVNYNAGDYAPQSGTLTVKKNVTQTVTLAPNLHKLSFNLTPSNAELTVTDSEGRPVEAQADGSWSVPKGTYSYTASAFGYEDATGTVTVETTDKTETVALTANAAQTVTFSYGAQPEGGETVAADAITVTTGDHTIAPTDADGLVFSLPIGCTYTWTFKSRGYAGQTGTLDFTTDPGAQSVTVPLVIRTAWDGTTKEQPTGSGSAEDPYQISCGEELAWLAEQVNTSYSGDFNAVLVKDVDLGDENWTPIGKNSSYPYEWTFDGQGHTVKGVKVTSGDNVGLFGYVKNVTIKNVTVEGEIKGGGSVGGLVGCFTGNSTMENCVNKATVNATGNNVGGLVGYIYTPTGTKTIQNCANLGTVSGANSVGGIAGYFYYGCTVTNCYNRGSVTASVSKAGGIAGYTYDNSAVISNCYTTGTVTAAQNAGAVIGMMTQGKPAKGSIFYLDSLPTDSYGTPVTDDALKAVPAALGAAFVKAPGSLNDGYPILDFQVVKYPVTFAVTPADAEVTIDGFTGTQEGGTWTFRLPDGEYDYTVSAFGYESAAGTVTVSGAGASESVTLTQLPTRQVAFQVQYGDNTRGVDPQAVVTCGAETVGEGALRYDLPYGDYAYTVRDKGYAKVTGTFTLAAGEGPLVILAVLEPTTAWDGESLEQPAGSGTEADPYEISTGAELAWLADYVNQGSGETAHAVLTADIDLGNNPWTPIGNSYSIKYKSVFDGQGHTVKGLNVSGAEYAGLFGQAEKATIKNVIVQGAVSGTDYVGGVLGQAASAVQVLNCGSVATVTGSGTNGVGGIVGRFHSGSDTASSVTGCYNAGAVSYDGTGWGYAGGIVGYDNGKAPISDCYNIGTVTSGKYAGGIRGYDGSSAGRISNCYNAGAVTGGGTSYQGGITPGTYAQIETSYYLETATADQHTGATAMSEAQMKQQTFADTLNGADGAAWKWDGVGYPILAWQASAGPEETDAPTVAEADFLLLTEKVLLEGQDPTMEVTPYLTWTPMENVTGYTLTLWKEWMRPTADGDYAPAHAKALTLTGVTGTSTDGLVVADVAADAGVKVYGENVTFSIGYGDFPAGRVYYNLKETLDELGEGRYYVTVTADGAPTPTETFVWGDPESAVGLGYAGDVQYVPYNRMSPVTGLRWEGTKACWDPKPYFDGDEDGYLLTIYQQNGDAWVEGRSMEVPGQYSKINCASYFTAVGGAYRFTVTALDDAAFGYSASRESELSPAYTVTSGQEPDGEWVEISTAEQWMELANTQDVTEDVNDPNSNLQAQAWSKNYRLANDLDFSDLAAKWETKTKSIGNIDHPFMGVLDGNGHKITGLTLSNHDSGLFWYVGATGLIRNLTIEGANILVSDNASVLAHNNNGTIQNCAVVNCNITADTGAVIGGMVSRNYGRIENSYVQGGALRSSSTTATGHGGFVGSNEAGGVIERCWTSMDVITQSEYAGGFVGLGYGDGTYDEPSYIRDCFALGNVTARGYSGGFVGRSVYNGNHYVNCYAAGTVTLSQEADPNNAYYDQHLHGFIGGNKPDSGFQYDQSLGVENCWFNAAVETEANYGAQPKTLAEMATDAFVSTLNKTEPLWERSEDKNGGLPYLVDVKAPEPLPTTEVTVQVALATYDKTGYAFSQLGETVSVTLESTGNTRVVDVLDAAQAQGLLTYSYDTTPTFGRYIHTINGYAVEDPDGWMFTVNDQLSNVSASLAAVADGDKILWFEGTTENHFQGPTWAELAGLEIEWTDIATVADLQALAASADPAVLAKNYRLTADLDLTGETFPGIGSAAAPFTGAFDGQGHTVSHVTVTGTENVGFFNVLQGATVKDLNLTDVTVSGTKNVGALAGAARATLNVADMAQSAACLIGGCSVTGQVTGAEAVGGLVGLNQGLLDSDTQFSSRSAIHNSTADVAVQSAGTGANKLGGLVGDNGGFVTAGAALGTVTAAGANMVGGLVGSNGGDVYDSHADGDVTGGGTVGGFVGLSTGAVKNSYSLGDVTADSTAGSFAGSLDAADTVLGAGAVTCAGSPVGGLAGSLNGQLVGVQNQITVKNVFAYCPEGVEAVGNKSSFNQSATALAALEAMELTTLRATADKLYELFGVNLPVPDALAAEADKYADTLFVPSDTAADTALTLLKEGQTADAGVTVTYETASDSALTGGSSLTLTTPAAGGSNVEEEVTLVLVDEDGNVFRKPVRVTLQAPVEQGALMDAIAAGYTATADEWAALDMALYGTLPGKTHALTEDARQALLDRMIATAAKDDATVSDRARLELTLRALGVDSTQLHTASGAQVDNAARLGAMDLTSGGCYAAPWVLLADLQGNLKLTEAQQASLITLLKDNMGDGLFGYQWEGTAYSDPDTACAALAALARSYDTSADAKAVVDAVLTALPGALGENGSLGSANSDAFAVIGLIALGRDPAELKAPSGASLVDGLLSWANGTRDGFLYAGADNALATEQGFRALVALALFDGAARNIYDFSANAVAPGYAAGAGAPSRPSDPVGSRDIRVTFTLKTDTETWVPTVTLTLREGSTVYHAFTQALDRAGLTAVGAEAGYVRSVTKDGVTLGEFDKGPNSGWLFLVNGVSSPVGLTQRTLADGDDVLFYYTLDWRTEPGAGEMGDTPAPAKHYEDVPQTFWAAEAIDAMTARGLFRGTSETTFSPNAALDRAMLTTLLFRLDEGKAQGSSPFGDVAAGTWYAEAVAWAGEQGLVEGTGAGFEPQRAITREEMVTLLWRYAKLTGMDASARADLTAYADAGAVSPWARDAMAWAVAAGLVKGRTTTELAPAGTATRAEAAVLLQRFLEQT